MTACEAFREYLVQCAKSAKRSPTGGAMPPGEILQTFDDLHQSHRENTGDNCQAVDRKLMREMKRVLTGIRLCDNIEQANIMVDEILGEEL